MQHFRRKFGTTCEVCDILSAVDRFGKESADGWLFLHDRRAPGGGNIDHVVVGPPGVAVIDAKNWSYAVEVRGGTIHTGKYRRTKAVEHLKEQVAVVSGVVGEAGATAAVRGYLALAGDLDHDRGCTALDEDLRLIGIDRLAGRLSSAPKALTRAQVEELFRVLSVALPPAGTRAPVAGVANVGDRPEAVQHRIFDGANRFFYLRTWRRRGNVRLYLTDAGGATLGWRDASSGEIRLDCGREDEVLAHAVLEGAEPAGVRLASTDLPRVATRVRGGRLLKVLGLHSAVFIGQEWRGHGKHRLYGTYIDPDAGRWDLGFVDVATGDIRASADGPLTKKHSEPEAYLRILYHRWPNRPDASEPRSG